MTDTPADENLVDLETLAELKDILAEDFNEFLDTFIADSLDRIQALEAALASLNLGALREASHSLKGSASNLGALQLTEACYALEHQAHEGNVENPQELVSNIKGLTEKIIPILQNMRVS